MKLIVETQTSIVKYAFADHSEVVIGDQAIVVNDDSAAPVLKISDMNNSNSELVIAELPAGEDLESFVGDKYLLQGDMWSDNPAYVEPKEESGL